LHVTEVTIFAAL